jgi:hypothetical protein
MSGLSADDAYSARKVHPTLGSTTMFWRGYTLGEIILLASPFMLVLVVLGLPFTPASFLLPGLGFALATTLFLFVLHRAKPYYLTLTEWLFARLSWAVKRKEYSHGGPEQDTLGVTRVKRVHPYAVERTDGAYVGAIRITPANMALEDREAWETAVSSLANLVNTTIDFKTKLYITARTLDNTEFVRDHQERLTDADVRSRPVFKRLLDQFIVEHTNENGEVATSDAIVREYYLMVPVTDQEISSATDYDAGVLRYLAGLPLLGTVVLQYQARELTVAEREELKREKLANRLAQVRRNANSLYRCSTSPVDAYELARLIKEYWSCEPQEYGDLSEAIGTFPVVGHGIAEAIETAPGAERFLDQERDAATDNEEPIDQQEDDKPRDESERTSPRIRESISQQHQSILAPAAIDWEKTHAVINGEHYVRTFWIEHFPEEPDDGFLERLLLETELETDISIHLDPFDSQSALDMMGDWISTLQVNKLDAGALRAEDIEYDINRAKYIRQLVRANKASFYRTGIFIRVVADSEAELRHKSQRLESIIKDTPANCTPKVAIRWPEQGLATVSPIGRNELGTDRMSTMTDEAVGALFPFSSNYLMMQSGIEYGFHGHNGSPIRLDPWELETGHSELVVGMPGAGKTFGVKERVLRMMKRRSDTMLVLLDPVGDLRGVVDSLDGRTITVSGNTKLNPLEIRKTPPHVLQQAGDTEPLAAKKEEVYAIIENFLASRGVTLEAQSGVVSYAIDRVYADAGVTKDVATHTPENSPTMQDLLAILDDISQNPQAHDIATAESALERAAEYADELAIALQPFRPGGSYANLSRASEIDVLEGDNKVVYIDLSQIEGSASGIEKQSFLMQLLMSTVYQQAKRTTKKVEFAIDEAHYLLKDQSNLDYLNTIFRHQRHVGLRMILISQTLQEFYASEAAAEITGMCPIKVFHRIPEFDDKTADRVGLTEEQRWFVRHADAGEEQRDYSEALVRIDEVGDYPIHIRADEFEKLVIDYEADDRRLIAELLDQDSDDLAEFRELLTGEAVKNALTSRYDLSEKTAIDLLQNGLADEEFIDGICTVIEKEYQPVADGGSNGTDDSLEGSDPNAS